MTFLDGHFARLLQIFERRRDERRWVWKGLHLVTAVEKKL